MIARVQRHFMIGNAVIWLANQPQNPKPMRAHGFDCDCGQSCARQNDKSGHTQCRSDAHAHTRTMLLQTYSRPTDSKYSFPRVINISHHPSHRIALTHTKCSCLLPAFARMIEMHASTCVHTQMRLHLREAAEQGGGGGGLQERRRRAYRVKGFDNIEYNI